MLVLPIRHIFKKQKKVKAKSNEERSKKVLKNEHEELKKSTIHY
jgi:hypothetical protein